MPADHKTEKTADCDIEIAAGGEQKFFSSPESKKGRKKQQYKDPAGCRRVTGGKLVPPFPPERYHGLNAEKSPLSSHFIKPRAVPEYLEQIDDKIVGDAQKNSGIFATSSIRSRVGLSQRLARLIAISVPRKVITNAAKESPALLSVKILRWARLGKDWFQRIKRTVMTSSSPNTWREGLLR